MDPSGTFCKKKETDQIMKKTGGHGDKRLHQKMQKGIDAHQAATLLSASIFAETSFMWFLPGSVRSLFDSVYLSSLPDAYRSDDPRIRLVKRDSVRIQDET